MVKILRRVFWVGLMGGVGFTGYTTWKRRNEAASAASAPHWPPFEPSKAAATQAGVDSSGGSGSEAESTLDSAWTTLTEPTIDGFADIAADTSTSTGTGTDTDTAGGRWVSPVDGACPSGYPIKANEQSKIFHVPGGLSYERTVPERCYAREDDAEADGYRRAKR